MSFMLKSFTIGVWWINAPNKPKPFAWTKTAGETPGPSPPTAGESATQDTSAVTGKRPASRR
jgi:hypothetical protein